MTELELESFFDRLFNRQPTEKEKNALLRLQKELGLPDDDSLWLLLVVLEHYEELYERIPTKIQTAVSYAVEQAYQAIDKKTEYFRHRVQAEVAQALLDQVEVTAVNRAKAARRWATAASAGLMALLSLVVGTGCYHWGQSNARQNAHAAQVWAQLANGRYAQKLDEYGVIADLRTCRLSGGDFRIPAEGGVICDNGGGNVGIRHIKPKELDPS